jgi:hypothetical protein
VLYRPFSTSRSGVLLGDVSSNGSITAFDASLILQYLVALVSLNPTQLTAADVSADGTVSPLDASYVLRYVVGIISGFPGLGKQAADTSIASSYEFRPQAGKSADQFELVLHLNGKSPIYGSQLKVEFDKKEISFVSLSKSSISDSLTSFSNVTDNSVSIAIAGTTPVKVEGDLLTLTFNAKNGIKRNWSTALHVASFVLNETNLAKSVSDVKIDMQTLKGIPTEFRLSQNYPNPFNPSTNIDYQLPVSGLVSLKVYDILGKEVSVLMNQEQKAGYYTLTWNGQNPSGRSVASGVYFYRVQVTTSDNRSFTAINHMLLLK